MTLSSWASDNRPSAMRLAGRCGRYEDFGGATEAIAADCTSFVGWASDPGIRIDCSAYASYSASVSWAPSGGVQSTVSYASGAPSGAENLAVDHCRVAKVPVVRVIVGRRVEPTMTGATTGNLGGTSLVTQSSNVATSAAMPGETGKTLGSTAGCLSITSSRVSVWVPCLA